MKYVIETKITDDGWTQEMVCTFQKEAIATLVLQDTEAQTWRRKAWDDNAPAATVKQKGNVVIVSCQHRRNWHNDYTVNKTCLELLAENWKDQADKWNKIHRYMAAALNPILTKMTDDISKLKAFCVTEIKEVKDVQTDILDCLDMDDNHISKVAKTLKDHTNKRFAHIRKEEADNG